jgi:hypothetical protein
MTSRKRIYSACYFEYVTSITSESTWRGWVLMAEGGDRHS